MPDQSRFFTLPRELWDMIYEYYLATKEGYFYNHETGQLVAANKQRVDVALAYTCKLAAAEMRGLAPSLNSIHFSTAYNDGIRNRAGRFEVLIDVIKTIKSCLLSVAFTCINAGTVVKVSNDYPHFLPIIHPLRG